jgi:glutathione synthase/RimK-type ligase-like ATP-grasp enzyme
MNQFPHIGTVELVSFPDDAINDVPAKIDTGADGSSIWASNMHVHKGVLTFNFFAPGSAYYREEPVKASVFRVISVRNSFGDEEFRYKIKLRISIGEQKLTRWFTLADRSRNSYPILLGKNFLKNKFVVDVSQRHLMSQSESTKTTLIFVKNLSENRAFFDKVAKQAPWITYECLTYKDLIFHIGDEIKVINAKTGTDLSTYGLTYFKDHHNHEFAFSVAEYLHYIGHPFIDREFANNMSASKLSEYMRLACYQIKVPPTVCAASPIFKTMFPELADQLGLPFVLKEIRGDRGRDNYLIQNRQDFDEILLSAPDKHVYAAQQYINNDGFYRVYVMGKDVTMAVRRSPVPHANRLKSHLNKPRGSANAVLVDPADLPGEAHDLAVQAADRLNRQICGVDLVQDKANGQWYVLEANNDPQIRSGSFPAEKVKMVAKFFDKELNH